MGAASLRGPSEHATVPGALPRSGAGSLSTQRARWYKAVPSVKIDTRSASYSAAAQIRQALSKARRHGAEQNRCALPPLRRGSYSVPHHVHSRLTAPTARPASRRHEHAGWRSGCGTTRGSWSWVRPPAGRHKGGCDLATRTAPLCKLGCNLAHLARRQWIRRDPAGLRYALVPLDLHSSVPFARFVAGLALGLYGVLWGVHRRHDGAMARPAINDPD